MSDIKANSKAVDRISKDLEDKVQTKAKDLPVVKIKDGKGSCPVCSQAVKMLDTLEGVKWVQVTLSCQSCGADLVLKAE
jgi:uncharacterized protein (UPF0212 family)